MRHTFKSLAVSISQFSSSKLSEHQLLVDPTLRYQLIMGALFYHFSLFYYHHLTISTIMRYNRVKPGVLLLLELITNNYDTLTCEASLTVDRRWAMINTVLPFIALSMASCTKCSLSASKALVACNRSMRPDMVLL